MPDIAPLDSAFMQMRCVHCGGDRGNHMRQLKLGESFPSEAFRICKLEPIDLPRRDAHVPVRREREGRML